MVNEVPDVGEAVAVRERRVVGVGAWLVAASNDLPICCVGRQPGCGDYHLLHSTEPLRSMPAPPPAATSSAITGTAPL